jgi:UDP-N-acetylmuramate dehydrogenase
VVASSQQELLIERAAPIPTWFGIGGKADRLVRPRSVMEVVRCVEIDRRLRVLGDGANLLVDDEGVPELVIAFTHAAMTRVTIDRESGLVTAMAGANLPKLINDTVRDGLGGLEGLAGIPATIGGAVMMNAGGAFGQIGDAVVCVHGVDRFGNTFLFPREQIEFGYRRSGLEDVIITSVELRLVRGDRAKLRTKQLEVMAYKKASQPMAEQSAGCIFKNPTLSAGVEGIGTAGQRVSAGMLIDRAGLKGLKSGGAEVSDVHGNFIVTPAGRAARAGDVIKLMDQVQRRVKDRFGVTLEPEVAVWRRAR